MFLKKSSKRKFLLLSQNDKKEYKNSICTFTFSFLFLDVFPLFSLLNLSVKTALLHKNSLASFF